MRELTGEELEPVDLIYGGFPCQPVSVAGKGLAQADERWLWPEFARLVRVVRPTYVLVENVPGLLGRGMGDVLGDLAALRYDAKWEMLPAAAFGAPHLRYRIFIVAYANGFRCGDSSERFREIRIFGGGDSPQGWGWPSEPHISRMVDGDPHRVDRLRGLGNAVVPQVAEWVGRQIMEAIE